MRIITALTIAALVSHVITGANAAEELAARQGGYRLSKAPSPYLRQHAADPVNWYMWGPEAFRRAREQNKPIFLSVGYASCYWCHVMARESFNDPKIAAMLNAHFIAVKVDRERRPDVDQTYMLATELISKQSGWPNSVFLTPDLEPFFGVGYLPRVSFKDTLARIAERWVNAREGILDEAARIAGLIQRQTNRRAGALDISPAALQRARRAILANFDDFHGGLGTAPKFPRESVLLFLLHMAERDRDNISLDAALLTIDNIIRGGIHDHLAGGFHRYAIDNAWAIPHFEKMLYNQALMVRVLLKAFELTGRRRYGDVARKTIDFVLTDMQRSDGGLASAFDAETNGKEGAHYLWTANAFRQVLGKDAVLAARVFGVTERGDHEGLNTLRLVVPIEELAGELKLSRSDLCVQIERVAGKLHRARRRRASVRRDDKVLTGWNALMARALAEAADVLGERRYGVAAAKIQAFTMEKLGGRGGKLKRSFFAGKASLEATQRDFAYVGLSALALFDHTGDKGFLDDATRLAREMDARFVDSSGGGLFLTRSVTGFTRSKDTVDDMLPSGNAAALELYRRLMNRTREVYWKQRVQSQLDAVSGLALAKPTSHAATLLAADMAQRGETGPRQFAVHGAVRVRVARRGDGNGVRVKLQLAPGWHINSSTPLQDFLVPARLEIDGTGRDAIVYPAAVTRRLAFHDEPLSVYEGEVDISAPLPNGERGQQAHRVKLEIQACSNRICLEPEIVAALVPAAMTDEVTCPW